MKGNIPDAGRRRRGPASIHVFAGLLGLLALVGAGPAQALGLGQATVHSYYQQPLDIRIDLISRSEAEMATVTAGLASPADFQVMGLNRAAIATPLEFTIQRGLADPHIRVTSTQPMNEPVVQLVVEVVWASGRMIKQYTLFLDPPAFDAPSPLPATPSARSDAPVAQAPAASARNTETGPPFEAAPQGATPAAESGRPPLDTEAPAPVFEPRTEDFSEVPEDVAPPSRDLVIDEPETADDTPGAASAEPAVSRDGSAALAQTDADTGPEGPEEGQPSTTGSESEAPVERDTAVDSVPPPADIVFRAVLPQPGQALPSAIDVQRGSTLWGLSRAYAEAQGTSVNQVMLAVQQKNPDAFIRGNINALMAGEVLRMPDRSEVLVTNAREAMLEVLRQEEIYRTRWDTPRSPDAEGTPSEPTETLAAATPEEESRLQLVPPSEGEDGEAPGMGQGTGGDAGVSTGESVVEELARAEEELANARQENNYLAERISELEAELAAREEEQESSGAVADANLAEMEERLRDERLDDEPEPELDLTPGESPASGFARYGWLILGLALLGVAGLVLFLRTRRDPEFLDAVDRDSSEPPTLPDSFPDDPPVASDDPDDGATRIQPPPNPDATPLEVEDPEARLDLARAYLAMGKEGEARQLLESVVTDGDAEQVVEAREMLAEL